MQKAARAVANENRKLRTLLNRHGIDDDKIEAYLVNKAISQPGDPSSPGFPAGSSGEAVASLERLLVTNNDTRTTVDSVVPFSPLTHLGSIANGRDSCGASVTSSMIPVHTTPWDASVVSPGARSAPPPLATLTGTMAVLSAANQHVHHPLLVAATAGPHTPPISTISPNESTTNLSGLRSSQSSGPGSPGDVMDPQQPHSATTPVLEFSGGVDHDSRHSSHPLHSPPHAAFGYDVQSRGYGDQGMYPPLPDTPSSTLDDHHHQDQQHGADTSGRHGYLLTPPHHQQSFYHSDHGDHRHNNHSDDAHMAALTTDLLASMTTTGAPGSTGGAANACASFGCLSDVSGACGDVDSVGGFGAVLDVGGPYSPVSLHL